MQTFTFTSVLAAALAGHLVSGAVLASEQVAARALIPKVPHSNSASLDKAECLWNSYSSLYVGFVALIPGGKSDALTKALKGSSACSGFSQYQDELMGAKNTTLFAGFIASDFCTAYDMTNIIKSATGKTIGCLQYKSDDKDGPGPDNTLVDLLEDGDDGEDDIFKRDASQAESVEGLFSMFENSLDFTQDLPAVTEGA